MKFRKIIALVMALILISMTLSAVAVNVSAASIKLNKTSAVIIKGQTLTLKVSGTSKTVKWSTSKKSVATVSSKGVVTAKDNGSATITANVAGKSLTCKVKVETPKISKTSATIIKGSTLTLKISGNSQKITWSTSKKSVATVSSKGVVTAKDNGSATITAKIGDKNYTCKVKVETPKISKTSATIFKGDTLTLKFSGNSQKITWSTSDKNVAAVSSSGVVTAKAKGTATITAKIAEKKYTCKITVEAPVISKTSITLVEAGTYTLSVSGTAQSVKWSTSDKNVAAVTSAGKVTAVKAGTATITAAIGSKKLTCKVTVTEPPVDMTKLPYTSYDLKGYVVCDVTNNNKTALSVKATVFYYDSKGKLMDMEENSEYCLEPGARALIDIPGPGNYEENPYSRYEIILSAEKAYYDASQYGVKYIALETSAASDSLIVKATNLGKDFYDIEISVLFYDAEGNVIDFDYDYLDCERAGTTDYVEFDYPWDDDYNTIVPASYEVIVNHAVSF